MNPFKKQHITVVQRRGAQLRSLGYTVDNKTLGLSRLDILVPIEMALHLDDSEWNEIVRVSRNYNKESADFLNKKIFEWMSVIYIKMDLESKGKIFASTSTIDELVEIALEEKRKNAETPDILVNNIIAGEVVNKEAVERAIRIMEIEMSTGSKIKKLEVSDVEDTDKKITLGVLKNKLKELNGTI